jgi:phosphoglycolate phosphatase
MRLDSIKNILFDLDGTLTDPLEGMMRCFHYAFERLSVPCPTEAELQLHIGPPLLSLYRERFSTEGMFENKVYEGVPQMLASLQSASKRLFVATSKLQAFTDQILVHFKLSAYFDGVYGSAPNGQFDNKVDLIRHLLASESLSAEETLMVGDRKYDVAGAKENGCLAAGVTYGYGSMEELMEAGADYLCCSPPDVAALFS